MDKSIDNSGFLDALSQFKDKQSKELIEVNKYPFKNEVIAAEEIKKVQEIGGYLKRLIADYKYNSKLVGSAQQREMLCQQYIAMAERSLDKEGIWQYKFTTDMLGAGASEEPISKSGLDSVYYMTHSCIGLRLKRVNFSKGLDHVVQPLMEKVIFEKADNNGNIKIKDKPEIEYSVNEYSSEDFYKALSEKPADYKSAINIHTDGDDIKGLTFKGVIKDNHSGDRVNEIIFAR